MNIFMTEQGLWSMLIQSSLLIQIIMLVLLGMSLSCWTIIISKFISYRRFRALVQDQIENFERAADLAEAMKASRLSAQSPLYSIGLAAIKEIQKL